MRPRLVLALAAWLLAAAPAHANFIFNGVLDVTGGGLVAPNASYGCPAASADCLVSQNYELVGAPAAGGSLADGYQDGHAPEGVLITLFVPSATFASTGGGPDLVFTNVSYQAFVPNLPLSFIQNGPATGTVSGLLDGVPFSTTSAAYNLTCAVVSYAGQCGVAFGPQLFTAGGENWLQTFNLDVHVGPEPSATSLVAVCLAGVAVRALRRRA